VHDRYDPWRHARRLGVRVIERPLPGPLRAFWHSPSRTVVLEESLSFREKRCSLAHEVVHVERRDECSQPAAVEAEVHLVAARRLIDLVALARVLSWTHEPRIVADELCVDEPTLECVLASLSDDEVEHLNRVLVA
jgi:hypothetical protein